MADVKDDIEKYRKGEFTPAQMHALEKKALSDPFLADALEGVESISPQDFSIDLFEISQRLASKREKVVWFTPFRIAAGLVLLISSFFLIYNFNQPDEQLALQKENASSPNKSSLLDSISKKDQPKFLSLDQPKEEPKTDLKAETGPTPNKADGSGEAKPTAGLSTSSQTAPTVVDEQAKADEIVSAELSEITSGEKTFEREKIAAAEPVQQELKKEAMDKDIVSRAKAKKSAVADDVHPQKMIRGQVTSSEDGLPLPGVNVTVKGTTIGAVTDMQGNYSIPVENGTQQLVFSFIGLQTSEVSPANKSTLDMKLLEDVSQLSEVVVTGQGFKSGRDENETAVIKLAEPFGGRKAYDKYLENNLRYPQQALESKVKGKVTIDFTIGTDGILRDFNILKSLGYGCDDEVIRLVKEGPKWYPSTEDNVAIESTVRVRMKFDPEKARK